MEKQQAITHGNPAPTAIRHPRQSGTHGNPISQSIPFDGIMREVLAIAVEKVPRE